MKEFKISPSMCGKIMGKRGLGKTGETYIKQFLTEQIYSRRKEFSNKYTKKGNLTENGSIDFINSQLGFEGVKNEEYFKNDFIQGTPDVILDDVIIDVKNSWDCFTFPFFSKEVPNDDYYWQAQCYMDLVGKDKYLLIYVLSDTPTFLIEKESYYWCRDNGVEDLDGEYFKMHQEKMTYSDIEDSKRIKVFEIDRNQEDIDKIYSRVEECRELIKTMV